MVIPGDILEELVAAAVSVRSRAHAPYSEFAVGAAVYAGGRIYRGCNVENASYPVGLCAERGAIAAAVADGQKIIDGVVVAAARAVPPCGMCRQAIAEFGPAATVVLVGVEDGQRIVTDMAALFPARFEL